LDGESLDDAQVPDGDSMNVLGLSCGNVNGSPELLLKAALRAAEGEGAAVKMVRLLDMQLPDDGDWYWEQLMECDALVVAVPILSRSIPGKLRMLGDLVLGPNADAAFIEAQLALRAEGKEPQVPFRVDERVLRPRVAGFISVGGSLPTRWKTLALPEMHAMTFSMHIGVVDQIQFGGAGLPGSVLLDERAVPRAEQLGRAIVGQIGRGSEDVEYKGDDPGLCPMCHLSVFAIRGDELECATCGARGRLVVRDGAVEAEFERDGLNESVISMAEKREHFHEVQETAQRQAPEADRIRELAAPLVAYDPLITPVAF
jgi:multimeric flavodoxin WrbA